MSTSIVMKSQIIRLLNDWYQEMLVQHVIKAGELKKEIDSKIYNMEEDQEILIYYSLLSFRYKMLIGEFDSKKTNINSISERTDTFLQYYYYFFEFIYAMELGNYYNAKKHYKVAESLLASIPDEAEKAEFNYRVSLFHCCISQPTLAISYALKAQDFFGKSLGYEVKTAACKNTLGVCCIALGQYELAEEYLVSAMNTFTNLNEEQLIIKVRCNLCLLYAEQKFSELAIQHLIYSFEEIEKDYKTIFLLASEYSKLKKFKEASRYIEKGLKICNREYEYHFNILKALNEEMPIEELEVIIEEAIRYFKEQNLWIEVKKYADWLAIQYFDVANEKKAIQYFYLSYEARRIIQQKEGVYV
ncbi:tetratricopeptide repeat protein [Bacillus cereus]|uniref:response regulator aspartate phosphatase n=1 Tax=Bacillus cereus TaxID=1396 RepID=UPI0018F691B4|nr:tetratricopeptide repeat protein [Bacillus cereus]MBJ8053671.1 tetratricopeptide repeat protein [Bacillus cereus]